MSLPLKDPTPSMPELNHTLLPRSLDPSCAAEPSKTETEISQVQPTQRHDPQLKLYVFDKLSSSEDNL